MNDFDNWFGVRFPNIQATIDQTNDQESKLLKLSCKEVWRHQQAIIDDLKTQLNNMESCYIKIKQINNAQSEIIQSHVAGREELQKRINEVLRMLGNDLEYVEQDHRGNFEFLKMAMIRCLGDAMKALRGAND